MHSDVICYFPHLLAFNLDFDVCQPGGCDEVLGEPALKIVKVSCIQNFAMYIVYYPGSASGDLFTHGRTEYLN